MRAILRLSTRDFAALALAASAVSLSAAPLSFSTAGFRIDALETPRESAAASSPLIMCLPATNGFAPNVNVQIQPYAEPLSSYAALSRQQFAQVKWKLRAEKLTDAAWIVEYEDPTAGKEIHFYAKAVSGGKSVYLVTATARADQWESVGEKLKKCVDSFTLE